MVFDKKICKKHGFFTYLGRKTWFFSTGFFQMVPALPPHAQGHPHSGTVGRAGESRVGHGQKE